MADVFISYAREDQDFVRKLQNALEERNRNSWIDLENIPLTAKWLEEVYAGIESANTFAFVISEDSINSDFCRLELAHAVKNNKRLVPIWHRNVEDEAVPHELASHQYIFLRDSDDFEEAFRRLIEALDTDLEWVHEHTWLLMRAKEWDSKSRDGSLLLRGKELKAAEALQAKEAEKEPKLTRLQQNYIQASHKAATKSKLLLLATVAFVLIVMGLGLVAVWERNKAATRELAGKALLMGDQGGESLQISALLAAEARNNRTGAAASIVADEVLRDVIALLARPGPRLSHETPVYAVAYSPDGEYVATASDDFAGLWKATSGKAVARLEHDGGVSNIIFSPNGRYVATATAVGTAYVWTVEGGERIARFEHKFAEEVSGQPSLAFSPDSKLLATSDGTKKAAYLWDISSNKQVKRLELDGPGLQVAFDPDGKYLATGSANVAQVWDVDSSREVSRVEHEQVVTGLEFSPDGERLATASYDHTAGVWDLESGKEVARFEHDGTLNGLDFSPDGKYLATASSDNTGRVWDIASGQEVARMHHLESVTRVAFSPDSKHVATASYDHTARIWDVESGSDLTLSHEGSVLYGVTFSPDGRYLATGGFDQTARVWDAKSGEEVARLEHDNIVKGVAFSPDSERLATASADGTARVWDVDTQKEVAKFEHDWQVYSVAFSPDGERLATASADGTARVWDVDTQKEVARETHDQQIWDVAFSPNGKFLALAGEDGKAWLWDIANKQANGAPMFHGGSVSSLNFSRDGKYLAAASYDYTARVWNVESGKEVARLTHDDILNGVAFSPDGKHLATTSSDGTVRVQQWLPAGLMNKACDHLTRNLTEAEWRRAVGGFYNRTCQGLPVPPED
jgi:WD40 repeat protein